jgi:autotransporter translocation and assembly factor TamB
LAVRLLLGGLVLLALVLGAEFYLAQGGLSDPVRRTLEARLTEALGGEVEMERVRLSLFPPTVIARGVTLPPAGDAFEGGTVAEVRVRLSFWSLVTGGVKALDIRAQSPDLAFNLPLPAEGKGGGTVLPAELPDWEVYGTHRVKLLDARVKVTRGGMTVVAENFALTGSPDVTLRRYDLALTGGAVTVNGAPVLTGTELELAVEADRVKVRRAAVFGEPGRLEASGELRPAEEPGGTGPYLTLRTGYAGDAAGGVALAARLGAPEIPLSGRVKADGRLYGTPGDLHWDGEVSGSDLGLADDPRRVETLEARLRVGEDAVEVVHVKARGGGGELRGDGEFALAAPHAYDARVRADDVSVAWALERDLPLGTLSGEARIQGERGERPRATAQWRYRHPAVRREPAPDDAGTPLVERLAVRLAEARGVARIEPDGRQSHDVSLETRATGVEARAELAPDGALSGDVEAHAADFSEIGALFGLDYVHGAVDGEGTLHGTLRAPRLEADATLADGRVRDLVVRRLVGRVVMEPTRIAFSGVRAGGDGALRLGGAITLPDKDAEWVGLGASLAASVHEVPLRELAALVPVAGGLDLDLPVSGKLHLVNGPAGLYTWSHVRAGAGEIYGQHIAGAEARLWIDPHAITLSDARFRLPPPAVGEAGVAASTLAQEAAEPVLHGDAVLRLGTGGDYRVTAETGALPLMSVDVLAGSTPFLTGTFAGTGTLTGDFSDPHLHLEGTLREAAFSGGAVGQGPVVADLSAWQLRLRGTLLAPPGREGSGRFVFVCRLKDDLPFAVAVRMARTDAVPWVRGLLPDLDALTREQLGEDYGLSAGGSVAAAGTLAGGPSRVRLDVTDARLTAGGRAARLAGPARVELADGLLTLSGVRLAGEGLDLAVTGTLRPAERFDLGVDGTVAAPWLALVRPAYGFEGGAAGLELEIAGPWDAPRVAGTVRPDALAVSPPPFQAAAARLTAGGRITVSGPLDEPLAGDIEARLADVDLSAFGYDLTAADAHLSARAGAFRLDGVELVGDVGQLRVEAEGRYPERIDLRAVGTVELAALVRHVEGLSQADGRAAVTAEVKGPWDAPRVRAGAAVDGGRVRIDALNQRLDVETAGILYTDGKVVLDSLEGRLGGGPVSAEGSYDTATGEVGLAASFDAYPVRTFPGLSGVVDGELFLSGRLPAPTLSGDLHVRQAVYDRRMPWGAWLMDSVTQGRAEVAREVPYGETRLALHVYGDDDIVVDNNIAKLVLDLDLAVGGTLQDPGLVGRVDVRQGEVQFRDHTFTVVSASVDFVQPDRIEPYLDVLAQTTVEHALPDDPLRTEPIEVDLSLTGPPDQMELQLTSRPDLPQQDLLSLLAVGLTTEELADSSSGLGASEATYLATGPLQSQLEEQVHRFTGLDQFQVEPFYPESSTASGSARLTVGKKLFDGKGLVIYSTVLDAAQEPLIQLSYRLSTRTSVLVEQDEEGRAGGELRFRFRFR